MDNFKQLPSRFKFFRIFDLRFWTLAICTLGVGVCLGAGLASYVFNDGAHQQTRLINENWLPGIEQLSQIRADLNEIRRAEAHVIFSKKESRASNLQAAKKLRENLLLTEEKYSSYITPAEEEILFLGYLRHRNSYFQQQDKLMLEVDAGADLQTSFLEDSAVAYADVLGYIDRLIEFNVREASRSQLAINKAHSESRRMHFISMIVLSTMFAMLLVRVAFLAINSDER